MPLCVCTRLGSGLLEQVWGGSTDLLEPWKEFWHLKKKFEKEEISELQEALILFSLKVRVSKWNFLVAIQFLLLFPGFPFPLRHRIVGQWLLIAVKFCLVHHSFCCPKALYKTSLWLSVDSEEMRAPLTSSSWWALLSHLMAALCIREIVQPRRRFRN